MRRRYFAFFTGIFVLLLCFHPITVNAQKFNSGAYEIVIDDDAGLLSSYEEELLYDVMSEISEYGNVAFKSISHNPKYNTYNYALDYYSSVFGSESGTVFLIDMDYRTIYIYSYGSIYRTITNSYADTITDNVYTYATNGNYYQCASKAFEQILSLLRGQKIAQPMKYISNALLAITLALLVNYFVVKLFSSTQKPSRGELVENTEHYCFFSAPMATFKHQTRKYSPQSSGSSGGGRSGGGGGGRSGGGGGHRF